MDNKTEFFTLKEDGVIGWIENMPEEPVPYGVGDEQYYGARMDEYKQALQSAISNAIDVNDVDQLVMKKIYGKDGLVDRLPENFYAWKDRSIGKVFPLQCHVEKKEQRRFSETRGIWSKWYDIEPDWASKSVFQSRTVALVTFSEPSAGVEETQEEIFDDLFCQYLDCIYNKEMSGYTANLEIQKQFTITRKNK